MNNRGKYFLLILFCFIKVCLLAQTTFNKTVDFSNGDESGSCILKQDDGYILIGAGWGFETGDYFDQKLKFAKTDLEGNVIWTNFIGESSINLFCGAQAGIIAQDGNIVFCGSRLNAATYAIILVKFNPLTGDTIFYKKFDFDDELKGIQVKELSDGNLIILGVDENDSYGSLLIKTSADGDLIWQKRYGTATENSSTDFAIYSDTLYLVNRYFMCSPEGYFIRKIDDEGNVIQTLTFDEGCASNGFLSNQGGYYGVGAYFPVPPYQTYIYRTNLSGIMEWHYNTAFDLDTLIYEDLFPEIIRELPNGDIIVAGYFASNYLGTYFGLVSKINMDGTPYWERIYTASTDVYEDSRLVDMQIVGDGEIALIGSGYGESTIEDQNFWILKLDSVGCLIPGCDTLDDAILELPVDNSGIIVYPNPVEYEAIIEISISQSEVINGSLYLRITTIDGKIITDDQVKNFNMNGNKYSFPFHRHNLPSGLYIIQVFNTTRLLGTSKILLK